VINPTLLVQDIPPEVMHMADSFFVTVGVLALGIPIVRALIRRWERGAQLPAPPSAEMTSRLERIEQGVEAIAIEVERIAEAQRYAAKLLTEQQKSLSSLPRSDVPSA
jgi:hypothetical protein